MQMDACYVDGGGGKLNHHVELVALCSSFLFPIWLNMHFALTAKEKG